MKMKYSRAYHQWMLIGLIILFGHISGWSQKNTRSIEKNFSIPPNGSVQIKNSYGSISLNHWDKDNVRFKVTITAEGKDESQLEAIFDGIDIQFDQGKNWVSAKTEIDISASSWWKNWRLFVNKSHNYSIDYVVHLPKSVALDLNNTYGNIFLTETDGKTRIKCAYGRIEIGQLNHAKNNIDLQYAPQSQIDFIQSGDIEADYSSINIKDADKISLDADYSKSSFEKINQLTFDADYGKISIGKLGSIEGNADYLSIKIGTLSDALDLVMDYGGLSVEKIEATTANFSLDTDYTGIALKANPNWAFSFTVETQYAGFKTDFPLNYQQKIIESTDRYYEGTHLDGKNRFEIKADYGSVKLYQN